MTPRADGFIPPCIPTRAYKVPAGPHWVQEIKHDGYRLRVHVRRQPGVRIVQDLQPSPSDL
jgi:ATP-dependent DNA ligase